jgi:hypothetical protein
VINAATYLEALCRNLMESVQKASTNGKARSGPAQRG